MIGIDNYNFEDKNKWRVMAWARIAARLKSINIHPQEALVLYLSGEQDLDRKHALRKGFLWNNLICVDVSKEKVKKLRDDGKIAIHGDINSVLCNWTHKHKPSVIYADFCTGLDRISFNLISGLMNLESAVVLMNLQRGRDSYSNCIRNILNDESSFIGETAKHYFGLDIDPNHRGRQFFAQMYILGILGKQIGRDEYEKLAYKIINNHQPSFLSYKGNRVTMDTAIFTNVHAKTETTDLEGRFKDMSNIRKLRSQISACMAHRTVLSR